MPQMGWIEIEETLSELPAAEAGMKNLSILSRIFWQFDQEESGRKGPISWVHDHPNREEQTKDDTWMVR